MSNHDVEDVASAGLRPNQRHAGAETLMGGGFITVLEVAVGIGL